MKTSKVLSWLNSNQNQSNHKMHVQRVRLGNYFDLPNPSLMTYLNRVKTGNPDIYRAPLYKSFTPSKVLAMWINRLRDIEGEYPTLFKYEIDQGNKVGPLSVMKPLKARMDDIAHYYDDVLLTSSPISRVAMESTIHEWDRYGYVSVRNQRDTVDKMKKSTSSGNPFFTKRRNVVSRTIPCTTLDDTQFLHNEKWPITALLGWRGQEGGPTSDEVKQRTVWMFPFAVNVCELQFYQPAIEFAQEHHIYAPWISMDDVDDEVTLLMDSKGKNDLIVCTDFTKFDQHFNRDMQNAAGYIIRNICDWRHNDQILSWLDYTFPIKYEIPLLISKDRIVKGDHGMASGSGGTNFDETIVHRSLQYEAALSAKSELNPHSMCLGDDGILSYPGITVDNVMQSYTRHGQEMNTTKQVASTQFCIFLRRWHHTNYRIGERCVGVYPTTRALGRLMFQERFYDPDVWGPEMVALRQLSIIENCKYHPQFHEFIRFCMKGDKYRLGIDIPGFLAHIDEIAHEATDLMPDFLGYTKSLQGQTQGIDGWEVVKYLRSQA